jgi:hypothetical protein
VSRLVAVFGIKWEPQWLVDDLMENLAPHVDDFAIVDCRDRTHEFWIHEHEYRLLQRKALEEKGAEWAFVTSPDERVTPDFSDHVRPLIDAWEAQDRIRRNGRVRRGHLPPIGVFPLLEMWTPTQARVDGIWGRKTRPRLYRLLPGQTYQDKRLQSVPHPVDRAYPRVTLPTPLIHLKNIEPENREARARAYEVCDPEYRLLPRSGGQFRRLDGDHGNRFEQQGYHYLADEEGVELAEAPAFHPPYTRPYYFRPDWSKA